MMETLATAESPATLADDPALQRIVDRVRAASAAGTPLCLRGGDTKSFYGEVPKGDPLDLGELRGISSYEPTELVVTARAGTPLSELEAALAQCGQCLAFEPPRFASGGTVGGMVAAGLSGPARANAGAVRDFVLGASLVNGQGEVLSFGGQVMKNVAGYDVSRLLAGSMGVLGVIAEVSLKVLPRAAATATVRFELDEAGALDRLNAWGAQPLPVSASAWWDGMLVLRLSGARAAVDAALHKLGGERVSEDLAADFWRGLRDQDDEFFDKARAAVRSASGAALWRLSLPQVAPVVSLPGEQLIEWGGAQRWWCTAAPAALVREVARKAGGHATLFLAGEERAQVFEPLAPALARIHRELKRAFDPQGVFNPGRLYPDF
ncbi:MAG TPA: glycolate oxidase subunit GlcE [Burkholderiaceae bacterium]|jgi:glycolate oxidase FAD binding subunit|nr:glycolate oxidase subunit GlcE [Burkholderiaceae bacterium]